MPFDKLTAPSGVEGLKRIEDHVLDKARAEAAKVLGEARRQADALLAAAREETDRRLKSELDRLKSELDAALDRELSGRRASRGQELLVDKSRVLDDAFKRAGDRLLKSPGYWDLLRRRLKELAGQKGGVLCRAEHRDTIGKYITELNRETGGKMPALADENASILGGFVLRGERVDVVFTLEGELATLREKILPELAAKAFPNT
jgi:vacuolar-type H+-ATPase subunit E/Vma4